MGSQRTRYNLSTAQKRQLNGRPNLVRMAYKRGRSETPEKVIINYKTKLGENMKQI